MADAKLDVEVVSVDKKVWTGEATFVRARTVDGEVRAIISASHAEATRLLLVHRAALDALASALLSRETLDEQEILAATGLPPAPALETRKLTSVETLATLNRRAIE